MFIAFLKMYKIIFTNFMTIIFFFFYKYQAGFLQGNSTVYQLIETDDQLQKPLMRVQQRA